MPNILFTPASLFTAFSVFWLILTMPGCVNDSDTPGTLGEVTSPKNGDKFLGGEVVNISWTGGSSNIDVAIRNGAGEWGTIKLLCTDRWDMACSDGCGNESLGVVETVGVVQAQQ